MIFKKPALVFIAISILGCNNLCKEIGLRSDSISKDISNKKNVKILSELSENEEHIFLKGSKIGRIIIFRNNNVLDISSDQDLTYSIFGANNSIQGLQNKYKNIFKLEYIKITDESPDTYNVLNKLTFEESQIITVLNPDTKKYDIVSSKITDQEIVLEKGIHVGMPKDVFFSKLFENSSSHNFSEIDTFLNGDELGSIQQFFIFELNALSKIEIKTDYEWLIVEEFAK
jgi:hypothetical protein